MSLLNATAPRFYVRDNKGNAIVGAKVYVYEAGTLDALTTWTDSAKTTPNANPAITDSTGAVDIWFEQSAKFDVKTSDDYQVPGYPVDNIPSNTSGLDGCLLGLTGNQTIPDDTSTYIIFNAANGIEVYDTGSFHDLDINPTRITIPAGITAIQLYGQVAFDHDATGTRYALINKNHGTSIYGFPQARMQATTVALSYPCINLASPPIEVIEGDYFELFVEQDSGGPLDARYGQIYFGMKVVSRT